MRRVDSENDARRVLPARHGLLARRVRGLARAARRRRGAGAVRGSRPRAAPRQRRADRARDQSLLVARARGSQCARRGVRQEVRAKLKFWRAGSEKVVQRIVTEARAGRFDFDVVETNGPELESLHREKLLQRADSPHFPDLMSEAIRPHREWIGTRLNMFVHAYNTNLVKKEELPRSYEDFLDPKWKGRLGIEAEDVDWFTMVIKEIGEDKGLKLFRAIVARNGLSVRRGHTLLAGLVASGEVPFALTVYNDNAGKLKQRGAPVGWYGIQPAIGYGYGHRNRPDLKSFNHVSLHVLGPLLVFTSLAGEDFQLEGNAAFVAGGVAVILVSGLIAWPVPILARVSPRTFVPPMMFNNCGNMGLPLAVRAVCAAHALREPAAGGAQLSPRRALPAGAGARRLPRADRQRLRHRVRAAGADAGLAPNLMLVGRNSVGAAGLDLLRMA